MNKRVAALAAALVVAAAASAPAFAGVVINETESIVSGQPGGGSPPPPHERTMMIEGNRQKLVMDGGRSVIIDLNKGTMDIIDSAQKNYIEMPFPPRGMMASAIGGPGIHASEFKKAGTSRTVAGYKCDDYNGSGQANMGDFQMVYCVTPNAPGAATYTTFQKAMIAKLKGASIPVPSSMPDGIPLIEDTTAKIGGNINLANLPPQAAEQIRQQLANRPPIVTKTEVSKVEEKKIADSEFEIPAGYTKRETKMGMGGGPGGHMMMGSPAAGASPAPKK